MWCQWATRTAGAGNIPAAVTVQKPTEFDRYRKSYRDAVERSIAFSGAGLDFFARVKARRLLDLSARRVGDPRSLSVLDVGCGPGETDSWLEGRLQRLSGVDVSAEMVEAARRRNPWAEYRVGDGGLPFSSEIFDVCFAVCVMHHVPRSERPALAGEMARVTRAGGIVVIFEHNPWNPLTRKAVAGCEFDRDVELLPRGESEALLRDVGLTDVEASYIVFFTRDSPRLQRIERRLGRLPLGAQHVVSGRRA
jgi:SAM-dependent methyltransferase